MTDGPVTAAERAVVGRQLGRAPRALVAVAHRCPCGQPDVVETAPRLEDGTPFPTLYYLTCPRATAAASRLESAGRMREWQDELGTDPELAAAYRAAHDSFLATRDARDVLPARASADMATGSSYSTSLPFFSSSHWSSESMNPGVFRTTASSCCIRAARSGRGCARGVYHS